MGERKIKDEIKYMALAKGFNLKEQPDGLMDLNPYVYEFARAYAAAKLNEAAEEVYALDESITGLADAHDLITECAARIDDVIKEVTNDT